VKKIQIIQVSLPPLPEQTAIAEVLSDMDGLITSLEKLIAKKKAIKQGYTWVVDLDLEKFAETKFPMTQ
jgi:type I restriction enzyme S subunit